MANLNLPEIEEIVAFSTASLTIFNLAAGDVITDVSLVTEVPLPGASLSLGTVAQPGLIFSNLPGTANQWHCDSEITISSTEVLTLTISGSPATGSGYVQVRIRR